MSSSVVVSVSWAMVVQNRLEASAWSAGIIYEQTPIAVRVHCRLTVVQYERDNHDIGSSKFT